MQRELSPGARDWQRVDDHHEHGCHLDPDGDGKYEYLKNGERCMKELGDSGLCSDLDGDGVAGYPDSG